MDVFMFKIAANETLKRILNGLSSFHQINTLSNQQVKTITANVVVALLQYY
jgi:hypothetical protein